MKHKSRVRRVVLSALVIGALTPLTNSAEAGPIPTRVALQTLLGGPGTLENFEAFSVPVGASAGLDCAVLDNSAVCSGQGPGLVVPGVSFTFGSGGGQWDGAAYFGSPSKELLSGTPAGQPLVINFGVPVRAFGVELRAFTGFNDTATMTIFGPDQTTVIGTLPGIALPSSGVTVFAGWEDAGGIGRVTLTESTWPWSPIIDDLEFGGPAGIACSQWQPEVGTWGPGSPPCGDLTSTTTSTKYESESFGTVFGDFTYQATLIATRPNQPSASNTLFLRGTPAPLQTSAQRWNTGYAFNFTTNGKFSIFRYNGGVTTTIQSWVVPVGTTINGSGSPNTLKVIAHGGTLTFFVNNVAVKAVSGETLLAGQVGVGMVRSIPTTGPGPNDTLEVVAAGVGPVEPGFGPRGPSGTDKGVSREQQKANELANLRNPNPDPLFDSARGVK